MNHGLKLHPDGTLEITMPKGNDDPASPYYKSCFWLKDYEAAKIRIIGLDGIHFNDKHRFSTSEQETWLKASLDETLDPSNKVYGYSVIIACTTSSVPAMPTRPMRPMFSMVFSTSSER